ncbi:hypothetical protein SO802_030799 [Lithocarpus litseifolius]|uniref:Transposase MuDR plant domain-containing protein n=1 Tax=Lithocarpus litseifolius TaxID=425828 RepID=A0AAW2BKA1_9ROSI
MFDLSPVMQAEVSSWTPREQSMKGMVFATKLVVRHALIWYAVRENFSFKTEHSNLERLMVSCEDNSCPWSIRAICCKGDNVWKIAKCKGPHTCDEIQNAHDGQMIGSAFLAYVLECYIREDPTYKIKNLCHVALADLKYEVSHYKVWDAKQKAVAAIYGDFKESYAELPHFLSKLCVISDRHPGIQVVFRDISRDFLQPPMTEHRYCLCHVCDNVNIRWNNETLTNLVWRAASATQERKFNATFKLIENVNWDAHQYLKDVPKEKLALTFDESYRYGVMTTNVSECFNGVLKGARSLPITAMVKYTWFKLNAYFDDRRNKSIAQLNSGKKWCKYALDIFMRNKARA